MAVGNLARALPITLEFEGLWSNHPKDPGGETMKGVTQRVYDAYRDGKGLPRQSVRHISDTALHDIYREGYWNAVKGDTLAAGVDLVVFDAAVNSGPGRALQWLRASLGGNHDETVRRVCGKRLSFVHGLSTWSTFGKGWARRIAKMEAVGVAWALAAMGRKPDAVKAESKAKAETLKKKADAQTGTATGSGTIGTGSGAGAAQASDDLTFWIIVAVAVAFAALAGFALYRAHINRVRAEAYAAVAQGA